MRPAALVVLVALAAACAGSGGGAPDIAGSRPPATLPAGLTTVPRSSSTTGPVGEVPDALLALVRADHAARTGGDPAAVAVLTAEAVIWTDGSLGCPRPGEVYRPAPTPGYRVVVEAAGRAYDYRLTEAGALRLCALPLPPAG